MKSHVLVNFRNNLLIVDTAYGMFFSKTVINIYVWSMYKLKNDESDPCLDIPTGRNLLFAGTTRTPGMNARGSNSAP